ncbi:extensin family protein [uncultured Paracoccus sp.]|uniref:extensin family protein n=1 Tax=uncultured Paracoccus sp. TaxID=189685 RepID=UPI00262B49CD|nr:extensin family protein [uncultured Paracoccus sp.]
MPRIRIKTIAGVPILYDRDPPENYGRTGYPVEPWIDSDFSIQAEKMFSQLFLALQSSGFGSVTHLLYGGIGRVGGGKPSYHHDNRAFDLDALRFSNNRVWVATSFPPYPHLYLAIESVVRQHFGTVLGYGYNAAHRDHIHFDNGEPPGFNRMAKSRVMFLQRALHYMFDESLAIDGVYGPQTRQVETRVRKLLGLETLTTRANWISFLGTAGGIALDRATASAEAGAAGATVA